jgi:hypothetical protein
LTTSSSAPWSSIPDNKFNVQEIEDVGLVPMASVTDLLTRTQEGEKFYGEVQ